MKKLRQIITEREKWFAKGLGAELRAILRDLPVLKTNCFNRDGVFHVESDDRVDLADVIPKFGKWKKGPFSLLGHQIDSEWRSDFKWDRLKVPEEHLQAKDVLDVGCNNGYFMFRMDEFAPKSVLGIDPVGVLKAQFQLIQHFARSPRLGFELLGAEHIGMLERVFDTIFYMGILYHHRDPLAHLKDLYGALSKGGVLYLETIGIPGDDAFAITPPGRYAGMNNVWLLPTLEMLKIWLSRSKFKDIEVVSTEWGGVNEQRSTALSAPVSYQDMLDPSDATKTVEGLPAPERFILRAYK